MAGSYDTGEEANKLRGEFQNYMGQTGQNISKFDFSELSAWLKSKKYSLQVSQQMGKVTNQLDKILLKVVQDSKRVGGGSQEQMPTTAGLSLRRGCWHGYN